MSDDFTWLDATAQAELVRRKEVSPQELVDAAIARIERLNPTLNAVIHPSFGKAREQARSRDLPDGPFRGVPFLLKDLGGVSAGDFYHAGMQCLRGAGWRETTDSYFTAKLRASGLCFLGRTNTPELGLLPTTEPTAYGPSRNPWRTERSPGGSSGGSAAAVAAGMVSAAHSSDGGGSIRIPAASCGLVGLKPTRGRSSFGPGIGERWAGFSCEGFVTRSVRDTAALLDVVAGAMPGDPYTAPPLPAPFATFVRPGARRRIGLMVGGPRELAVNADCAEAARKTGKALADLGHEVTPSYPEALDDVAGVTAYVGVIASATARALDYWGEKLGRPLNDNDVEPLTWALAETARTRTATDYLAAVEAVHAFARRVVAWWGQGFDLLLTPTTAEPPPPIGHFRATKDDPFQGFLRAAPFGAFTLNFNLTGQPAISLPVHWTADGLPVGAHLVAPYGREDMLLEVAAELEGVFSWQDRRPPAAKA